MYTRTSRRSRSSSSGSGSAYYQIHPGGAQGAGETASGTMPTLTSSSSTEVYRPRAERPSSAPAPTSAALGSEDLAHVEQRLKIIKRNRSSRHKAAAAAVIPIAGLTDGVVSSRPYQSPAERIYLPEPQEPPCSAYPTFSRSRMPKHDQHVMEAMVGECLDVLFFPTALQDP